MRVELEKTFRFEAAHLLPNVPEGHKCRRLHGHSFVVDVAVRGDVDAKVGWLVDYADIRAAFGPVYETVDHRYLNEIEGLENPTSEILAAWIWARLAPALPGLHRVTVRETCTTACSYYGPDGGRRE
jgi:6-pyruvoyltetrahydropterin/6-carboxytetrahydropterin synthase